MNPELKPTSKIELKKQPNSSDVARIVTNEPEAEDRKTGFSTREKVFATLGALGLLSGGAVAANHFSSTPESADKNPNVTGPAAAGTNETTAPTIDATPSPYASPTNTEFLNTAKPVIDTQPSDVIESGLFEGLSAEQQAEIKSFDSMTVEQFRAQPIEKQLVFAQFVYDNNAPRILKNMRDYGFDYEAYANRVTEPSETNTAQQVVDSASMVIDVAGNLYNDKNEYDLDTARKMLALGVDETSAAYEGYDSYLQTREIGLTMTTSTDISASKTFETEQGPLMKINYAKDEKFGQTSYQFVTFKDITGADRGAWKWLLSVPQTDGRFDATVQ